MENSINNNNKDINETSVDHQLLCTVCNKPFNDPQSLSCGHNPINKASAAIDGHNLSSDITFDQNDQQNQYSATVLFEPIRDLLSDLINQNKQLREEINQIKKQSQLQLNEQLEKNKELQIKIEQLEKQSQLQHQTLTEQLKNQNTKIQEIDQRHNRLEINVESIRPIMKYLPDTKWKQQGITINTEDCQENKLSKPRGIFIDNDQNIYVADSENHRIVQWKRNATSGQLVAGGNGKGNQTNQLNLPIDVIVDKENNSLIIADRGNRRIIRWSLENNTTNGEIIVRDVYCWSLAIDKDGSLYVSDEKKNEVRRWKRGDQHGTIVAGGNGKGDHLNQFNWPAYIFVDEDYSLYVSDHNNHRVMKWLKDAKEGIVVAGGNNWGNSLTQLSYPQGVIVDQLGQIYAADGGYHRVMRWCRGAKQGTVVVGENGKGNQSNQLNYPHGLSFDQQGNLYVVDFENNRIQKFEIIRCS